MKIINIYLCIVLFMISACSSVKTIHSQSKTPTKIADANNDARLQEEKKNEPIFRNDFAELELYDGVSINNKFNTTNPSSSFNFNSTNVGIFIYDGFYKTIGAIEFLRRFDHERYNVKVISGQGIGAVVAAMYASGMTAERIEWAFHKYFNKSDGHELYSEKWVKNAQKELFPMLKGKRLEELPKKFILPVYNKQKNKVEFVDKGDLYEVLKDNLSMADDFDGRVYSTSLENNNFDLSVFSLFKTNYLIGIDFVSKKPTFKNTKGSLIQTIEKMKSVNYKSRRQLNLKIEIKDDLVVDDESLVAQYIENGRRFSEEAIRRLLQQVKKR